MDWSVVLLLIFVPHIHCEVAYNFSSEEDFDWYKEILPQSNSLLIPVNLFYNTEGELEETPAVKTPTPTCQLLVQTFGQAISNYTLCSVKNARPIHLCENCVKQYIEVKKVHEVFTATLDEKGNVCRDYFFNLDKVEIVSEAYKYVNRLWRKANCDSCFEKDANGTLTAEPTESTKKFNKLFHETKICFKEHTNDTLVNATCTFCEDVYGNLTDSYVAIQEGSDSICMDIVDSMNITRFLWSNKYHCVHRKGVSLQMRIVLGCWILLPLTFYLTAYLLANKQEAPIIQQKRVAEIFAVHSSNTNLAQDSTIQNLQPSSTSRFLNPNLISCLNNRQPTSSARR